MSTDMGSISFSGPPLTCIFPRQCLSYSAEAVSIFPILLLSFCHRQAEGNLLFTAGIHSPITVSDPALRRNFPMQVPGSGRDGSQAVPAGARWPGWLRAIATKLSGPLFAVVLAICIGSIVILMTSTGSPEDRWGTVTAAYSALWQGSFGSWASVS